MDDIFNDPGRGAPLAVAHFRDPYRLPSCRSIRTVQCTYPLQPRTAPSLSCTSRESLKISSMTLVVGLPLQLPTSVTHTGTRQRRSCSWLQRVCTLDSSYTAARRLTSPSAT